ncbi:hypothetical protein MHU86_19421 [Fragilaria crotonensis]|nr:hypothetical protein MHU86_19421 [Fragilaria crotonensis]
MTRIGYHATLPIALRRHPDADLYHVACDPKRIPFSLAVRLIPVYTTGPSGQTIYQAWALPHLNDALRDPELQLFNNFLSYYHTAKENHPEFPFIDLMGSDSPVPNYGRNSCTNRPANANFCTKRTPNCNFFTHDEHGDEIPAQNDTTGENPTQNTTDSPEIHSQQLISDAETTYDEHAQTTQQLPGTQPNLAFLPPNSPETSSSHSVKSPASAANPPLPEIDP